MLEPFSLPFVQRGVLEVLLLAPAAGCSEPGSFCAARPSSSMRPAPRPFPASCSRTASDLPRRSARLAPRALFALVVTTLGRRHRGEQDSLVAVALVGCLAAGAILASDVFESGAHVESLLFGSLLLIGTGDMVLAGCCSAAVLGLSLVLGDRWLARGFDSEGADALGVRSSLPRWCCSGCSRSRPSPRSTPSGACS